MTDNKEITVNDFFGLLKGNITKTKKNIKKWRKDFSKDAERLHTKHLLLRK
jgi:hypothetical protein